MRSRLALRIYLAAIPREMWRYRGKWIRRDVIFYDNKFFRINAVEIIHNENVTKDIICHMHFSIITVWPAVLIERTWNYSFLIELYRSAGPTVQ